MFVMRMCVVVVCAVVLSAVPAAAQSVRFPVSTPVFAAAQPSAAATPNRSGFWFSGGLGFGSLGCEDCGDRELSGIADLSLGGTLGDRLLLGAAVSAWSKDEDGVALTVSTLEARVRFYPIAAKGFYLTGGLGLGSIRLDIDRVGDETENGLGLTLGAGWDIRVARNVSITPFWHGTAVSANDADFNRGSLGLAVTIH